MKADLVTEQNQVLCQEGFTHTRILLWLIMVHKHSKRKLYKKKRVALNINVQNVQMMFRRTCVVSLYIHYDDLTENCLTQSLLTRSRQG